MYFVYTTPIPEHNQDLGAMIKLPICTIIFCLGGGFGIKKHCSN